MNMRLKTRGPDQGYILLPVVILISVIAAIALFNSEQSSMNLQLLSNEWEKTGAEYVAQAGLQHAMEQAARQGCGPYSNLSAVAFGDHSYSVTLNTTQGATSSYSLSVDQDNWIQSDSPSMNHGSSSPLRVTQAPNEYRPLYRYDLAAIPAGSTILSATAWFYVETPHPQGPVTIHRITENWTEAGATWGNMFYNFEAAILATIPPQEVAGQWVPVNLTAQVQAWVNGQANHGITLRPGGAGIDAEYSSRDSANAPWLEVISGGLPAADSSISATGTLASGTSHSLTAQNFRLQQMPPLQRSFQPGASLTADSWIDSADTLNTHGIDPTLGVADDSRRALLGFDLANALPVGASLTSATLQLYVPQVNSAGSLQAFGLQRDWVESDATWDSYDGTNNWDNPGGDADPAASAQVSIAAANSWYSLDITDIAGQWQRGTRPNHGLLLTAQAADLLINSSDHGDSSTHPRLILGYSCQCGVGCALPQGNGRIAFIYDGIFGLLRPEDKVKIAYFESWGYSVDSYEDNLLSLLIPGNYDVLYISSTAASNNVGSQFNGTSIGIVSEESLLIDDFDMASNSFTQSGETIDIVNSSHFITSPFAPGTLPIYSEPMELITVGGTVASELQSLAEIGAVGSLVAVDKGAALLGGETASGRRVNLPLGRSLESSFNWDYLNNNGLLMVQRSIEWSKPVGCTDNDYRDNFDNIAFDNNDGSLAWTDDWQEVDGHGAGPGDGNVLISGGILRMDDRPNRDGPEISREFNLNGAYGAVLSFNFTLGNQTNPDIDIAVLDISTDGVNWTPLQNFTQWDGGYSGDLRFDLSAHLSATTRIRFRITAGYNTPNRDLEIDNLRVSVCGNVI